MWRSCKKPPLPYFRVEIKDVNERLYLGFYAGKGCWLQTDGHEVIRDPEFWRFLKPGSALEEAFNFKISQRNMAKACKGAV